MLDPIRNLGWHYPEKCPFYDSPDTNPCHNPHLIVLEAGERAIA
ncbi:MAG: hypothetical protein VKJ64_08940 [Leptolyngbyaceae bacterium]|nr:hypothetical protein [Leptolyngbyaceae bacterium]